MGISHPKYRRSTNMEKKKLSFEDKLARLEQIVTEAEQGKLPLQDTIRLHEEGEKLIKELREELSAAEKKLQENGVDAEEGTK